MASKKVQVYIEETGKQLAQFGTKTLTKLFKKIPGHTVDVLIQQPGEMKSMVGKYTVQGDVAQPPDPVDKAPVIDAGQDITVVEGAEVTIDGSGKDDGKIVRVEWKFDPELEHHVTLTDDPFELKFHAPELLDTEDAHGYLFRLEVEDDKSNISRDTCLITVTQKGELPPPPPPPPSGKLLYDSNTDGGWNNGKKRVVTESEGNVGPNGKGLYTAASGDPELLIEGDGVAHLVSGSGGVSNISLKGLCRHQEGGACENRGGGEGIGVSHSDWDVKREKCHNIHSSIDDGNLPQALKDYQWYTLYYSWKHESGGLHMVAKIDYGDGPKKFADCVDKNPDAWFNNKELNQKNSYVWIRLNNADHGRIYILVINWDAEMKLDFMFEPKENSIALRNVTVTAL